MSTRAAELARALRVIARLAGIVGACAVATLAASTALADALPMPEASAASGVTHVVTEGETLWDIARAYGVKVEELVAANALSDNAIKRLRKGSQLIVPGARATVDVSTASDRIRERSSLPPPKDGAHHFVEEGETLWDIARSYDVPLDALMERNGMSEDDDLGGLRVGQAIVVPGVKPSDVKQAPKRARVGITHELQPGETVWDLAHQYKVSVREIITANRLSADEASMLRDGKRLFLPGVERDRRGAIKRPPSERERRARVVANRLGLGTITAAGKLLHGRIEPRWIRAAEPAGAFRGTLKWPVANGWFVRGFGSGQGGYHKAMDIMGKMGWNVRAAAPGIVGYSGDEVPGFGNMVMVVHAGGFVTLYAHNSVNFVHAGERVTRGQVIAEVGSTGRSQGPHVHFELIHQNNNCDPAPLFRPGVKNRSGKLARLKYASWNRVGKKPAEVRCARRQKHPTAQWVINEDPDKEASAVEEDQSAPDPDREPPADEDESP